MTSPTLYGFWRSSASYRVRIALNLKGIEWRHVAVNLRAADQQSEAFASRNPQKLVPWFEDGDVGLAQSLAIIGYLERAYPEPPLLPADPIERAKVEAAALTVACDIHPLNNLRVLNYLKSDLNQDAAAVDAWARHWIGMGFEALEQTARASTGPYLFGSAVTLSDICLVPQVYNARRVGTDLGPYPTLVSIDAALREIKAFADAAPEVQPDAA